MTVDSRRRLIIRLWRAGKTNFVLINSLFGFVPWLLSEPIVVYNALNRRKMVQSLRSLFLAHVDFDVAHRLGVGVP